MFAHGTLQQFAGDFGQTTLSSLQFFFEGDLADAPSTSTKKMQETGPTAFCPDLRRPECLTACRCRSKGSTFSSVILRP